MPDLDEYLRNELRRTIRPIDVNDVSSRINIRRTRRVRVRKVQAVALTVVVIVGTLGGVAVLSNVFREASPGSIGDASPLPIVPKANGVIVAAQQLHNGPLRLASVNPDGSDQHVIDTQISGDPWLPAWSPDGTKLAVAVFPFDAPRAVWVMDADGANPVKIVEGDNVSQPSWSPDGSEIAYALDTTQGSSIHIIEADGTGDRVIGDTIRGNDYFSVSFSPDGTQLVFDRGTDSASGIFVMNADGSDVRLISSGPSDYNPSWSPDGTRILFTRQEEGAESDIYVMDADGSNVGRLTNDGPGVTNFNAGFSPDGERVAYVAGVTGGPGSVVVMNADGTHPVTILNDGVLGISWQPVPVTATPAPTSADLGLGFPVCDVQAFVGNWGGDADTVYLGTKMGDVGGCPPRDAGATQVLGIDTTGDGKVDMVYGPLQCYPLQTEPAPCRLVGAADINADGVLEPIVQISETGGTAILEAFWVNASRLEPVTFCGGCGPGIADWGGSGGHREGAYCDTDNGQPVFVSWNANLNDQATEYIGSRSVWAFDGQRAVKLRTESFSVPLDRPDGFPPGGGDTLCGSRLDLPAGR